jgi:hypothetical protein
MPRALTRLQDRSSRTDVEHPAARGEVPGFVRWLPKILTQYCEVNGCLKQLFIFGPEKAGSSDKWRTIAFLGRVICFRSRRLHLSSRNVYRQNQNAKAPIIAGTAFQQCVREISGPAGTSFDAAIGQSLQIPFPDAFELFRSEPEALIFPRR